MSGAWGWDPLPYEGWRATRDTLHAHAQVLGKLAAHMAPPEPQLQHAALRLSARGIETLALPAPDGSGALVVAIDLHMHETILEHSDGRRFAVALVPDRPVGAVTREVLDRVRELAGEVAFDLRPQEVPWATPLDQDTEHATYDRDRVSAFFAAATRAAAVLARLRAPYRGRCTPVNTWWGSFDLAVSLFSGARADPPSSDFIIRNAMDSQEIAVGWWPGDQRYPRAAFYAYAHPAPPNFELATLAPPSARWEQTLGEYVLDWDDVCSSDDPAGAAFSFGASAVRFACTLCEWDPALADSALGTPPPVS